MYYEGVRNTIETYHPDVIVLNCCDARLPYGRLIMDLADIERVCADAPWAEIIASHMDNVNHAMITRKDVHAFIQEKYLDNVRVPEDGEILSYERKTHEHSDQS